MRLTHVEKRRCDTYVRLLCQSITVCTRALLVAILTCCLRAESSALKCYMTAIGVELAQQILILLRESLNQSPCLTKLATEKFSLFPRSSLPSLHLLAPVLEGLIAPLYCLCRRVGKSQSWQK